MTHVGWYKGGIIVSTRLHSHPLILHLATLSALHISIMSPARVGIIGAGMSGPVLATFLKSRGYDPVIYERTDAPPDAGLGIRQDSKFCLSSHAN